MSKNQLKLNNSIRFWHKLHIKKIPYFSGLRVVIYYLKKRYTFSGCNALKISLECSTFFLKVVSFYKDGGKIFVELAKVVSIEKGKAQTLFNITDKAHTHRRRKRALKVSQSATFNFHRNFKVMNRKCWPSVLLKFNNNTFAERNYGRMIITAIYVQTWCMKLLTRCFTFLRGGYTMGQ